MSIFNLESLATSEKIRRPHSDQQSSFIVPYLGADASRQPFVLSYIEGDF